jgi:type IV secretory pathway VirB9-like protein
MMITPPWFSLPRTFGAALLLASVSVPALSHAATQSAATPDSGAQIRVVAYSPVRRTEIVGLIGQPTTITFPQGENVYRVVQTGRLTKEGSLGDAGWQGASAADVKDTPLGNNLTLWPATLGESTMSVITVTSTGVQKVYPFRLVAISDSDGAADAPGVTLNLIFKGGTASVTEASASDPPGDDPPAPRIKRRRHDINERAVAAMRLRTDSFNPADDRCHYVAKGVHPNSLEPRCPLSNGVWTLMRFPGLSKKPAIYIVGRDGSERLARQHAAGDFIVIEEIAPHFRLRLGPDVLDILNTAYNPAGSPPDTGTTAPTVQRDILQAKTP